MKTLIERTRMVWEILSTKSQGVLQVRGENNRMGEEGGGGGEDLGMQEG